MKSFIKKNKWPLLIIVATLAVRIVYLLQVARDPAFYAIMVDEKWHWLWAQEILTKSFWGEGSYFRAPLYPYFLAALALITNNSILWSKMLQVLLCGGTAFFIFKTSDYLFDRKTAITSGLIYALYGTLVFYETMFLIPAIFLLFVVWGMYRLVIHRSGSPWRTMLFSGIIFGLAALAIPNILLTVPFLMVWLYFRSDKKQTTLNRGRDAVLLLLGLILMITPVTIRNKIVTGDFILISSQGGINLYLGNNTDADGLTMLIPEVRLNEAISWDQFGKATRAAAEREAMRSLSDAEESSFWSAKATKFMFENPGQFLNLLWRKTVYLLSGYENSDNADIYYQRSKSGLFWALVWHKLIYFPYGLLLPLTVVGIYLKREQFSQLIPVYIYLLAYIPSIILFLVTARHRLPLIPFMIILASAGLTKLLAGSVKGRRLVVAAILLVVTLVVFNKTYFDEGQSSGFQVHFNNGIKYDQLNDVVRAEQEYQLADNIFSSSPTLINSLAFAQFRNGKYALAAQNFARAIALKPDYSAPYNNLGLLMLKQSAPDSAVVLFRKGISFYKKDAARPNELSQMYANLAEAFDRKEMPDSAAVLYTKAIDTGPENFAAYTSAAGFYSRREQFNLVDTLYARAEHLNDLSGADYFNWGLTWLKRQNYSAMLQMMFRAIKRDPTLSQAYYGIALGYYQSQQPADSVKKYLDICLRATPTYPPALDLQKRLSGKN